MTGFLSFTPNMSQDSTTSDFVHWTNTMNLVDYTKYCFEWSPSNEIEYTHVRTKEANINNT